MGRPKRRVKAYAATDPRLTFVDVWPAMLGVYGTAAPRSSSSEDRLHMNARGYAIWTRILRPSVESEFGAPAGVK